MSEFDPAFANLGPATTGLGALAGAGAAVAGTAAAASALRSAITATTTPPNVMDKAMADWSSTDVLDWLGDIGLSAEQAQGMQRAFAHYNNQCEDPEDVINGPALMQTTMISLKQMLRCSGSPVTRDLAGGIIQARDEQLTAYQARPRANNQATAQTIAAAAVAHSRSRAASRSAGTPPPSSPGSDESDEEIIMASFNPRDLDPTPTVPPPQPNNGQQGKDFVRQSYPLFLEGDEVILFGNVTRTVTREMHSLLGHADNTLARIPQRLEPAARQLIANIVLSNMAIMPWQERCVTVSTDDDMWVDSVLLSWNADIHNHLIQIPEQAGKTGEMGLLNLYLFMVCGCAPIVTVKTSGGRMSGGAGEMMEADLNKQLSGCAGTEGFVPTIKDFLDHIQTTHPGTLNSQIDQQYFFMRAVLKPSGRGTLYNRSPDGGLEPWNIHILLQNKSNIKHVAHLSKFMRDSYGPKTVRRGGLRGRVALINDEDDLNFSGGGSACSAPMMAMQEARKNAMYGVSVTATGSTILLDVTDLQVYIRAKLSANYHGIANDRVAWNVFPPEQLADGVMLPSTGQFPLGIPFPPFGDSASKCLNGARGDKADFETIELAKMAYVDMSNAPNKVLDGWRHANISLRRSDSQQYAAIYFASLSVRNDVITMEWHSGSVRCTLFYANDVADNATGTASKKRKRSRVAVRLYFSEPEWDHAQHVWRLDSSDYDARLLTTDFLVTNKVITQDAVTRGQHQNVVMVDFADHYNMRSALSLVERLWRPNAAGDRADPFASNRPQRSIRLMNFCGLINGRQMPNKSEDHGTLLTDQIYRVRVNGDGLNANTSGATASQQISRICTVTMHQLNSEPMIWCTADTKDWIVEETHMAQKELCHLQNTLPSGVRVHDWLRDNSLDCAQYPILARMKDKVDVKIDTAKDPERCSIQMKALATSVKGAKAAGEDFREADQPTNRRGPTRALRLGVRRAPQFNSQEDITAPKLPENPKEARRHIEKQKTIHENNLLTSLKSAAKLQIFDQGRVESGFSSWRQIIAYFEENFTPTGEDLPNFESVLTDADVAAMVRNLSDEVAKEVRDLLGGDHRFKPRLLDRRISPDSPSGLFKHTQTGWVMADFLRLKLETLGQKQTPGASRRNLRDLWTAAGTSKEKKGHMVIRTVLRLLLTGFNEQYKRLPKATEFGWIDSLLSREKVDEVLQLFNYGGNYGINSLTTGRRVGTRGGSMWLWATLVRAPSTGAQASPLDEFSLSPEWLTHLDEAPNLTMENLYNDLPDDKVLQDCEDGSQATAPAAAPRYRGTTSPV